MPRQLPQLDLNVPAHRFAVLLRRLRDGATRRPTNSRDAKALKSRQRTPLKVDEVANRYDVSRAAIYAALSGSRLPSVDTLTAMIRAWSPNADDEMGIWMERLRAAQEGTLIPLDDPSPAPRDAPIPDWYLSIRWQDEEPMMRHWRFNAYLMECMERAGKNRWADVAEGTGLEAVTVRQIAEGRVFPTWKSWDAIAKSLGLNEEERRYGQTLLEPDDRKIRTLAL